MKTLVIGAHGLTGKRLVDALATTGHTPVAMIRETRQRAHFDSVGVATVLADLEYPIDHAVRGCEAVIFAAGSGSGTGVDKTVLVDQLGAIRSMVSAQVNGATRYIMLSTVNADVNSNSKISHYHRAKAHADNHLMDTDLDWTVVCPGRLTEEPGTALVSVRNESFVSGVTSRESLALVLAQCLGRPNSIRARFSVLDGELSIDEALAGVRASPRSG
ncbi:MAG: NAD(P)H-binding protein [Chromatiales bacterium]|jgi:uncharacterized protein YbjT (DUF2867 family)|nr:NAD(P)H-binding protein [Chromatiales bacterium]